MEPEKFLLKDHLFNTAKVSSLAIEIKAVYPAFKKDLFIKDATRHFDTLELKARIYAIWSCMVWYDCLDTRATIFCTFCFYAKEEAYT